MQSVRAASPCGELSASASATLRLAAGSGWTGPPYPYRAAISRLNSLRSALLMVGPLGWCTSMPVGTGQRNPLSAMHGSIRRASA